MAVLKRILLLTALLGLGAQSAGAALLPQATGGFGIAPARRDVVGVPGLELTPTNVINRTSSNYKVTVFPAILTQKLSGAFDFAATPRSLNDARLVLSTSPTQFALGSGANQQVNLRWNLLPTGHKWIVMGVVFQGVAQGQAGPVHVVTRLLSVNFLRLPGLTNINGNFTGLYAQQFGSRVLRFTSRVRNIGDRFWAPTDGRIMIRDSSGHVAYSAPWTGTVVVPGAQVDFPVDVHQLLPAGQYTATTTMRFGSHHRSTSTAFTLVGPNQLPTPAITIHAFNATGEIGSPAKVTARIVSSGTAPANLTLHLFLGSAQSVGRTASALATGAVTYAHLRPGAVVQLSHGLGGALHKGSYRVIATWTDATGASHMVEADFTATPAHSWLDSLWRFIKEHIVLFVGLLVLALLILLAAIVRRLRGRQQEIEAELSAAHAQLRAERLHGRADVAKQRLAARAAKEPSAASVGEEPEPEPEPPAPAVMQPPALVHEPPAVVAPPPRTSPEPVAPPESSSDWIPPWERERRGR
jgi:hypothetical protein